ncbi:hypothetical protein EXU48_05865 [Occultella glacieicola]|uniref:histidine kinase n=1 Tax=Occultella glacieicola TaxID=2518684 RepID=A0ABY2E6U5_9MICO|nr:histidine kinase [Occultella glacieicola]TDE95788.1 hypothetical protein EXU48_05865 [Occultella glacieicola]
MSTRGRDRLLGLALVAATVALPVGSGNLALLLVPAVVAGAFLVGRRMRSFRIALVAFGAGALVNLFLVWLRNPDSFLSDWLVSLLGQFLGVILPWWVGRYLWLREEQRLRLQEIVSDQARLRERARIAQEVHDTIGHDLAMIALGSGALELAPDAPERIRAAAAEVRSRAVAATDRLHTVVELLRDDASPASRVPGTEGVDDLVARAHDAGVAVRLRSSGDLPPSVAPVAHRVVQEALTNAARHAPGADVSVTVDATEDPVVVLVVNDAAQHRGDDPRAPRAGLGLIGLSERVRLAGGRLDAGPRAGGGFEVVAHVPRTPDPSASAQGEDAATQRLVIHARRQSRRRQWQPAMIPLALACILGAVLLGLQVLTVRTTGLAPEAFQQIETGVERAEIADLLPPRSIPADGVPVPIPPAPEPSRCEFYLARSGALDFGSDFFRICFDRGVVVATDRLTPDRDR